MLRARVISKDGVQFIELPTEIRIETDCIGIIRDGEGIILRPMLISAKEIFDCLVQMPKDFFADCREDFPSQFNESLR